MQSDGKSLAEENWTDEDRPWLEDQWIRMFQVDEVVENMPHVT